MAITSDRRRFLVSAFTAPWLASRAAGATGAEVRAREPTLDIHVHLFGVGEGGTSVLGTAGRVRDFTRLLDEPLVRGRLLHGSDFPFPAAPTAFAARIGEDAARQIDREKNWLKKDLDLKEALGVGLDSANRAFQVAKAGLP